MEILYLKPPDIKIDPDLPLPTLEGDEYERLKKDIRINGIQEFTSVVEVPDGGYVVLVDHNRFVPRRSSA